MSEVLGKIQSVGEVVITRTLDLGEYDEAYCGAAFEVWVAPTRAHLKEWEDLTRWIAEENRKAQANPLGKMPEEKRADEEKRREDVLAAFEERRLEWYAKTWRNISLDEARQIRDNLNATNPLAWDWLMTRTSQMIGQFKKEKLGN